MNKEKFNIIVNKERFLRDGENLKAEEYLYNFTYPEFIKYFNNINTITKHHLIIGINFIYGWMPTAFNFRSENFDQALRILNDAKRGLNPTETELELLKGLLNNSLVGTAKLLHFINPDVFAIWDSRVYRYLTGKEPHSYRIGNCKSYLSFLGYCKLLTTEVEYDSVHQSICYKFGVKMTKLRTAELIMFINGTKKALEK